MRLYEEIFGRIDGMGTERCIFIPNGEGYFEGVKSIGDFTDEKIVIYFSTRIVEVFGNRLSIVKYGEGDLRLCGQILSLQFIDKNAPKPNKGDV